MAIGLLSNTMTSDNLRESIEHLYETFSRYGRPASRDVSPYAGIRDADVQRLTSRPLRQLQPSDVQAYARHALTTWGDDRQFRHYLPRLFELLTVGSNWTDVELLIGKLHPDWAAWPEDERSAVVQYFDALWEWAPESNPDTIRAGDILRGLGLAGLDLSPFLDRWRRAPSHASSLQLAFLVFYEQSALRASRRVKTSWHPKDREQVSRFLLAPETRAKLEAAYLAQPDHPSAGDLAEAVEVLDNIIEVRLRNAPRVGRPPRES